MSVPKVFNTYITPDNNYSADYRSKHDALKPETPWKIDRQGDDYYLRFKIYTSSNRQSELFDDTDFQATVSKIECWSEFEFIPASLIVGKKTGDILTLKDGSVVKLTCVDFHLLHQQITQAFRKVHLVHKAIPGVSDIARARLTEIQTLITNNYGEPDKPISAESKEDVVQLKNEEKNSLSDSNTFFSYIKTALWEIAVFFVRLFTCNWSEKICINDAKNEFISL